MSEKIIYKGKTILVDQDTDATSPRDPEYQDNVGKMICWHRRYNLGDKHDFKGTADLTEREQFREWWEENGKGGVLLPLYLYDHSGITMSTGPFSCPWDSGQVGYIYCTAADVEREWGKYPDSEKTPLQRADAYLKAEVKEYDTYLRGEIYCFEVVGEDASSCGYYGEQDAIDEAKSRVDDIVEREREARQEKLKKLVKHQVPLEKRVLT